MNCHGKRTFTWSQKIFVLLYILTIVRNHTAFASPISSWQLMDPQFMKSVVADCCTVKVTDTHHHHEKLVPEGYDKPNKGPMVELSHSPFYRQQITRKNCVVNSHPSHHHCSRFSGSNICQTDYAKQKVIVKEGYIGEIWVADGCKFDRL